MLTTPSVRTFGSSVRRRANRLVEGARAMPQAYPSYQEG